MDIDKSRYTKRVDPDGISERGELMVWFRRVLNEANERDGRETHFVGYYAKKLQGIKTRDLGRDLYYIKKKMEEAQQTGFPVGVVFYGAVRKLREARKSELQQML